MPISCLSLHAGSGNRSPPRAVHETHRLASGHRIVCQLLRVKSGTPRYRRWKCWGCCRRGERSERWRSECDWRADWGHDHGGDHCDGRCRQQRWGKNRRRLCHRRRSDGWRIGHWRPVCRRELGRRIGHRRHVRWPVCWRRPFGPRGCHGNRRPAGRGCRLGRPAGRGQGRGRDRWRAHGRSIRNWRRGRGSGWRRRHQR
jgi:hypothetical protein